MRRVFAVGICLWHGISIILIGVFSPVLSVLSADGVGTWLVANAESGRLSYYASAMVFGMYLITRSLKRQVSEYSYAQYIILAAAISTLGFVYALEMQIRYVEVLAFAVFFITSDFMLIDRYVVHQRRRLASFDAVRLAVFNFIILAALNYVIYHVRLSETATAGKEGPAAASVVATVSFAVGSFYTWVKSVQVLCYLGLQRHA